jgi:DNA-binding transcriptional MerR regulator
MGGDTLYSIGDLARRTGLTVRTIRFYSDRGIVPPADRSPAGYCRYGIDAVARLDLVRTLRDLGVDLSTIRKALAGGSSGEMTLSGWAPSRQAMCGTPCAAATSPARSPRRRRDRVSPLPR